MDYMEPIEFARNLRQAATSYEQLFWQLLRNRQRCGKKFRRQHPLGFYTADFYCVEAKLDVEIEGSPHETVEGKRKYVARDALVSRSAAGGRRSDSKNKGWDHWRLPV